ncbi:hypothetical protein GRJ22_14210 [Photobacterium carnosum]|uniref:hypothetical protein n=1 Tax=Photobacterium carnosum TaxID=2023717 RepID=UPI001E56EDA0|nr:hypothetical protein [Photobacterium carnosum]MCD9557575.1 hypothetical protein [Photobacterium carnosum]
MLYQMGKQISFDELASLPELVKSLTTNANIRQNIVMLRDESLFNYRNSGEVIAQQLIDIQASVNGGEYSLMNISAADVSNKMDLAG